MSKNFTVELVGGNINYRMRNTGDEDWNSTYIWRQLENIVRWIKKKCLIN
jgi:hypothetical protein